MLNFEQLSKTKTSRRPEHAKPPTRKGKPQTPMMNLSSNICWVIFQLKGAAGNIKRASHAVGANPSRLDCSKFAQNKMLNLIAMTNQMAKELQYLADGWALLNKDKMPAKPLEVAQKPSRTRQAPSKALKKVA